uniref:Uncharacterized protein n=1 Tax=Anguilla anguilla TaxID=7936 RepID=A0A0E9SJJ7_ANGAN
MQTKCSKERETVQMAQFRRRSSFRRRALMS